MSPTATLDPRFSSTEADASTWEQAQRRIDAAEVAWLVTVRRDGRPHSTPVVPVRLDGDVYFHTSEPEQKYVNLQSNPHVLVLAGDSAWSTGVDVVVEGAAERVADDAVLAKLAALYAERWDGRWQLSVRDGGLAPSDGDGGGSVAFKVTPAKAFAHAKGDPFGMTTFRF